jgi:2,3-bisphosphoglycerate-dependent phosphoglycerate mutase
MYIAMIRHGEYDQPPRTPSAWLPQPLTDEGRLQSEQAARTLRSLASEHGLVIDPVIDCSRMRRAWDTAQVIGRCLTGPLESEFTACEFDDLAERGLGALANLSVDEIERLIADDPRYEALPAKWKSQSDFKLPVQGAESLLEAGQRVASHIQQRTLGLGDRVLKLFVGHGASMRHAAHLMGILHFEQIAALSMHYASPVVFEHPPTGKWVHVAGDWKVRRKEEAYD